MLETKKAYRRPLRLPHAAALALIAWYLIAPPLMGSGGLIAAHAPIPQWERVRSYDTLANCRAGRTRHLRQIEETYGSQTTIFKQLAKGLCVAAGDPRLAKEGGQK